MSACVIGGQLQANGYARMVTPDGRRLAHRVVWEEAHGPIPEGRQIHHRCGNKACVNVEHLQMLTAQEHGKLHPRPLKCAHTERTTRANGRGYCATCEREWDTRSTERRRTQRRLRYQNDPAYRARRLAENRKARASV